MKMLPEHRLGKWAVGITIGCIALLVVFFLLRVVGVVDFDTGHAWDATVGIIVPLELIAFILSIIAIRKEKSVLTWCSLMLGVLAIVFLLTHSLFISD